MKVDTGIHADITSAAATAQRLEALGYDAAWGAEAGRDPFLPLAVATQATTRMQFGTNIAVAFARNPMTVASSANDLQAASQGRFILGLGSQIKAHIEKRYSMPWSHPAARMREFVLAMRAIWDSWSEGTKLDFRGDFYTHTLMTPFFVPPRHEYGPPKVFVAAVGPLMTEVAGEVADGFLVHPFTTPEYMRQQTLPALERGLAKSGRSLADFEVHVTAMAVTGAKQKEAIVRQLAFYGSTPAYKPVLDEHGWGDLQPELNRLSKLGDWQTMGTLITDEIVETFAVVDTPDKVAAGVAAKFAGLATRVAFYLDSLPDEVLAEAISTLRSA